MDLSQNSPEISQHVEPVVGLAVNEVDWNIYADSSHARQVLSSRAIDFVDSQDFLLRQYLELKREDHIPIASSLFSGTSPRLSEFLHKKRPKNIFFTPEMLSKATENDQQIRIKKEQNGDIEMWNFSLVENDDSAQNLVLSRSLSPSSNAGVEPYLGVTFRADYDSEDESISFFPELITYKKLTLEGPLIDRIRKHLGITTPRIKQRIKFLINETPVLYRDLETFDFGSLGDFPRIKIDLDSHRY